MVIRDVQGFLSLVKGIMNVRFFDARLDILKCSECVDGERKEGSATFTSPQSSVWRTTGDDAEQA